MTDIPENIMKAAHDAAMSFGNAVDAKESMSRLHLVEQEKLVHIIAAALLAERQSARNAALEEAAAWHDKEADKYAEKRTWAHKLATHQISAAEIRALKTEQKP